MILITEEHLNTLKHWKSKGQNKEIPLSPQNFDARFYRVPSVG